MIKEREGLMLCLVTRNRRKEAHSWKCLLVSSVTESLIILVPKLTEDTSHRRTVQKQREIQLQKVHSDFDYVNRIPK